MYNKSMNLIMSIIWDFLLLQYVETISILFLFPSGGDHLQHEGLKLTA